MSKLRALKYLTFALLPISVSISFLFHGGWTLSAVVFAFILVPTIELFIKPRSTNLSDAEKELIANDKIYDVLVFSVLPVQLLFLFWFLICIQEIDLTWMEIFGRISAMGLICGVFGINVAHELGHRSSSLAKWCSLTLLLSSLYMHFRIEHNRGHHKKVATLDDPATARFGEGIYRFWLRSIVMSYVSAWSIQLSELKRSNSPFLSLKNEMLCYQVAHLLLLLVVYSWGSWVLVGYFASAALLGILLLETVNYIEHYGMLRERKGEFRYENVLPAHSWNSDHVMGRLMLFELTRHSDHHHNSKKKYQSLDSRSDAPAMPTGYPGMMVIALIPPLWFWIMHKRIKSIPQGD